MPALLPDLVPDELISSLVARAADQYGISVRRVARMAFGEPHICHPQHPKHLPQVAACLGVKTVPELICSHTTYLLIAPFLERSKQKAYWDWMSGNAMDGRRCLARPPHALFKKYRYCPDCFREWRKSGEDCRWLRNWQLPTSTVCLKHGTPLIELEEPFRDAYGVSRLLLPDAVDLTNGKAAIQTPHSLLLTKTAANLLSARNEWTPASQIASQEEWREFYSRQDLARIDRGMKDYWGCQWLNSMGIASARSLMTGSGLNSWLHNLILLKGLDPEIDLAAFCWSRQMLRG